MITPNLASVANHLMSSCWSTIRAPIAAFIIAASTLAPIGSAQAVQVYSLTNAPNFSLGWTHVVQAGNGYTLFYNAKTGAVATGTMSGSGFVTVKSYPPGFFALGWTSIVPVDGGLFFYNASNGSGAFGVVSPFGDYTNLTNWTAGLFSTGWTSITANAKDSNLLLFYNATNGNEAIDWIH